MKLPRHEAQLFLAHNEHRNYYISAEEHIADLGLAEDFESPDSMRRAIETGSLWVLHWYPDTPVGFLRVAAPTLDELLAYAAKVEAADNAAYRKDPQE